MTVSPSRAEIDAILRAFLDRAASADEIERFLTERSNLPGPRGNLELAAAFADAVVASDADSRLWALLLDWTMIGPDGVSTDDPRVFLPFVALQTLGALCPTADVARRVGTVLALKRAASDPRWRVREGVAMGFQRIAEADFDAARRVFDDWLPGAGLLERRAILASLAHPPILGEPGRAAYCLAVSERIVTALTELPRAARRDEPFRTLRLGLEYAISVFAAYDPDPGFALLERLARSSDPDARRIAKANLGKARLAKRYPERVAGLLALLGTSA
jgi:hypothetical protein